MPRSHKLNELGDALEPLDYPTTREVAMHELDDVVLQYADGEERLQTVLGRCTSTVYQDPDELASEIRANLGLGAVGEPGQSEGEG